MKYEFMGTPLWAEQYELKRTIDYASHGLDATTPPEGAGWFLLDYIETPDNSGDIYGTCLWARKRSKPRSPDHQQAAASKRAALIEQKALALLAKVDRDDVSNSPFRVFPHLQLEQLRAAILSNKETQS